MRDSSTRPLLFLGSCLAFAETTLGMLAGFVGTNGTLAAIFALVSLGMVLLALVAMYFRDPAFLAFSSQQSLDLRIVQELRDNPDTPSLYLEGVLSRDERRWPAPPFASPSQVGDNVLEDLVNEFRILGGADDHD